MPKSSKKPKKTVAELVAVRYAQGKEQEVTDKLKSLGKVTSSPSQQLLILEISEAEQTTKELQTLLDEGLVDFMTPVLVDKESQLKQIPTNEVTVRFKDQPSKKHLKDFSQEYGVKVDRQNEFVPRQYVVKVETSQGKLVLEAAKSISKSDEIEFATPNYISEFEH